MSRFYKVANWRQIKKASKNKLFKIGGHSFRHSILTNISVNDANQDISITKKMIFKNISYKVKHFSYPEGKTNSQIIKLMKKNKILTCPLAHGIRNNHNQDPYKLKRIMVGFERTKFPFKH